MSTAKQQDYSTLTKLFKLDNEYDDLVLQRIKTIHDSSIINFSNVKYRNDLVMRQINMLFDKGDKLKQKIKKDNTYMRFILELLCSEYYEDCEQFLRMIISSKHDLVSDEVIVDDEIIFPGLIEYAIVLMEDHVINKTYLDTLFEYKKPQSMLYSYDGYESKDGRYNRNGDPDDFIKLGTTFGIMVARANVSLEELYFLNNQSKHEYALSYCNYLFQMRYRYGDIARIDYIEQIINFYCDNDLEDIELHNIDFHHYANAIDRWMDARALIRFNDEEHLIVDNLTIILIIIVYMLLQDCDEHSITLLKKLMVKFENEIKVALVFLSCVGEDNINSLVPENYKTLMDASLVANKMIIFVSYDEDKGDYVVICDTNGKKILKYDEYINYDEELELPALKSKFYRVDMYDDIVYFDDNENISVDYGELCEYCFGPSGLNTKPAIK